MTNAELSTIAIAMYRTDQDFRDYAAQGKSLQQLHSFLVHSLIDNLQIQNPQVDWHKFLLACGAQD